MAASRLCSIEDCNKPVQNGRGWCSAHYARWRNHGDPLGGGPARNATSQQTVQCERCGTDFSTQYRSAKQQRFCSRRCSYAAISERPRDWLPRFWSKVLRAGPDECWEWQAGVDDFGYGCFGIAGNDIRKAHRVSWMIHTGAWPEGDCILHRCDNPPCCNPRHLFVGTRTDNMIDKCAKGRQPLGERVGSAKLTTADVLAIRADTGLYRPLAIQFGVSESHISVIKSRKVWAWLPADGEVES